MFCRRNVQVEIKMRVIGIFIVTLTIIVFGVLAYDEEPQSDTPYSDKIRKDPKSSKPYKEYAERGLNNEGPKANNDGIRNKYRTEFEKIDEFGSKSMKDSKTVQHRFEQGHYDNVHQGFKFAEKAFNEADSEMEAENNKAAKDAKARRKQEDDDKDAVDVDDDDEDDKPPPAPAPQPDAAEEKKEEEGSDNDSPLNELPEEEIPVADVSDEI